ncbi:MAG: hypothetical protein QGI10_10440 [Vicinamibacterales bacterium]|jgi:hypothetical protein|nr:hypothetical protein [Vicinamibacterales bacterium]MDP7691750.1 hypothetical protein [Vicinamibacterales bacterium]HJN47089.1 hypothetical protein [Vicinamibacterales bacterium]
MTTNTQVPDPECARYAEAIDVLVDASDDTANRHPLTTLDDHLAGCEPCRRLLADLRQIKSLAGTLEPLEPPTHVWHTLSRRAAADTGARGASQRPWWQYSLGGAIATAAALLLAVVMTPERWASPTGPTTPTAPRDATVSGGQDVTLELGLVERHSIEALDDLARLAAADQARVAPVTVVLTQHLAMIDGAIADIRLALATEPDSTVARSRLRAGLQHKVTLLQATAATARHLSQGTP